ncbi:MAG: TetR/AcrR family transcriptional regulator [Deltaproteobacteria bacterium]|nr:MAG: TetR/AcrR family transcriptional regulator [Deltaproteobacteria bacterium]
MNLSPRERILQAADEVFGRVGFDAASTRDIAEAAGVNKALIHYHFKTKDGLLTAVLEGYYGRLTDTLRGVLLRPSGSLRERMRDLVGAYLDFLHANLSFVRIVQREAGGGRHVDLVAERTLPLLALGRALLRERYPTTHGGAMAAEQLLVSFYGMLVAGFTFGPTLARLLESDPTSDAALDQRKRHVAHLVDLIFDVLDRGDGDDAEAAR